MVAAILKNPFARFRPGMVRWVGRVGRQSPARHKTQYARSGR
jgi:hypothetical protein